MRKVIRADTNYIKVRIGTETVQKLLSCFQTPVFEST